MTHMQMSRRYLMNGFLAAMLPAVAAAEDAPNGAVSSRPSEDDPARRAKELATSIKHIDAGVLNVGYVEMGPASGWPVVLLHGFPYDIHAYDEVAPQLAAEGARVIVPYLRGYGPTRFLSAATPRSGQQAALGADLLALLDALEIRSALLAGYDWGGRAACIVAALWPERAKGLVSYNSYNIQNIAKAMVPDAPEKEHSLWYQYYFHSERGRAGLAKDRKALTKLLWKLWSPTWAFDDATFERSAAAFDHPDFVDVVIQSYRHRHQNAAGDPALADIEARLAARPAITVPTIVLHGEADGVGPVAGSEGHAKHFSNSFERRVIPVAGHFLPQEAPEAVIQAVTDLGRRS